MHNLHVLYVYPSNKDYKHQLIVKVKDEKNIKEIVVLLI